MSTTGMYVCTEIYEISRTCSIQGNDTGRGFHQNIIRQWQSDLFIFFNYFINNKTRFTIMNHDI